MHSPRIVPQNCPRPRHTTPTASREVLPFDVWLSVSQAFRVVTNRRVAGGCNSPRLLGKSLPLTHTKIAPIVALYARSNTSSHYIPGRLLCQGRVFWPETRGYRISGVCLGQAGGDRSLSFRLCYNVQESPSPRSAHNPAGRGRGRPRLRYIFTVCWWRNGP